MLSSAVCRVSFSAQTCLSEFDEMLDGISCERSMEDTLSWKEDSPIIFMMSSSTFCCSWDLADSWSSRLLAAGSSLLSSSRKSMEKREVCFGALMI